MAPAGRPLLLAFWLFSSWCSAPLPPVSLDASSFLRPSRTRSRDAGSDSGLIGSDPWGVAVPSGSVVDVEGQMQKGMLLLVKERSVEGRSSGVS
ncbi:hypothetical protein ACP70R_039694 [Stipagrostis hirtigluma subsp. patula]